LFLALFSKDSLKYAPSGMLSKNRLSAWHHRRWRQGYTARRQPYWRQDHCVDTCMELTWRVSWRHYHWRQVWRHRSWASFLFFSLFSKDSHKYAPDSKILKNGPFSWRRCYWCQDPTSRRQSNWRQTLCPR
jgi:hypothetical protein